jgi:hypothetical protein
LSRRRETLQARAIRQKSAGEISAKTPASEDLDWRRIAHQAEKIKKIWIVFDDPEA